MADPAPQSDGDGARPPGGPDVPPKRPSPLANPRVRVVLLLVGIVVVIGVAVLGFRWFTHGRFVQSTNDAYVRADQVTVAPKVSGYVEAVYVADNQAVAAGQPLLKIDTANYDATLATQRATAAAREADIEAARRQVAQQQEAVAQASAQLKGAQDAAAYADHEAERYKLLSSQGVETQQRYAQAVDQRNQAQATARANAAAKAQAERQVATLSAQVGQAEAQLKAAQAQVTTAQINLGDTLIRAAIAGRIGDKSVRLGQFVQPGARLMSVVPVQDVYLVGNFKETQIGRMQIGQRATVSLDAFGGRKIEAVVDSFSPGTGAQFALLPPENATGNFTKIVQRVPVRFRLRPPQDLQGRILPGLSATVSVDTSAAPERQRAAR
ncbi:HlyD family secretion protein [Phenylobacterium sp.]|uniref:HlyD family secretion protein n=1 Tax=Phenylobacterium sp. TaxID=1871053 RepID=UPI0025CDAD12|nr:HlyD family secretion protein [Phenylobacterium sp.]